MRRSAGRRWQRHRSPRVTDGAWSAGSPDGRPEQSRRFSRWFSQPAAAWLGDLRHSSITIGDEGQRRCRPHVAAGGRELYEGYLVDWRQSQGGLRAPWLIHRCCRRVRRVQGVCRHRRQEAGHQPQAGRPVLTWIDWSGCPPVRQRHDLSSSWQRTTGAASTPSRTR